MKRHRWPGAARVLVLLLTLLGSSVAAGRAAQSAHAAPTQALFLTTEVERLVVDNPADVWSSGSMVIGGQNVIIPRNLLIDFPANRLTLQQTFAGAPAACLANGRSGHVLFPAVTKVQAPESALGSWH